MGRLAVTGPWGAPKNPVFLFFFFFHGRLNRKVGNRFLPVQTPVPGVQKPPGRGHGGRGGGGGGGGKAGGRSPRGLSPKKTPSRCTPQKRAGRSRHSGTVLNFISLFSDTGLS